MLRRMNETVAILLRKNDLPPSNIIDLGCGTGATMQQLLAYFPKARITGVNIDEAQVRLAKAALTNAGLSARAAILHADFQATGLPAQSFEAAYALETSCYGRGENKSAFLAEAARLLRPGGRLVVVDGFRKHGRELPWLPKLLYKKNLEAWGMPSLAQITKFEKALHTQGFEQVKTCDISWNMLPSLAFIPWVVTKLICSNLAQKDAAKSWYIRALLLTLALAPFKRHFAYCTVTCVKSSVE